MSVGTLMGIVTAIFLVLFLGIVAWAYSSRRRADFDEASRLPLNDNGDDRQHGERRS
ncbi:cytochrome c oxidase subunit [Salinisphaera sp. S4-8]|uniref:cbb3-type cytochrome oxidase subunit 3 n=1 Tax=Salinisphaera sp. S4-8 TaxID=633357 RepID=UPI00333F97ED